MYPIGLVSIFLASFRPFRARYVRVEEDNAVGILASRVGARRSLRRVASCPETIERRIDRTETVIAVTADPVGHRRARQRLPVRLPHRARAIDDKHSGRPLS